jgi:anti-sigma regulatory factor (Ser/Thr protein kinase)
VSELVTNGVIHDGGDDIVVRARIEDEQIRLEVLTADGPSGPAANLRPEGETGRGIFIVASVTGGLEIEEAGPGRRRVTCRVPLSG